MELNFTYHQN